MEFSFTKFGKIEKEEMWGCKSVVWFDTFQIRYDNYAPNWNC